MEFWGLNFTAKFLEGSLILIVLFFDEKNLPALTLLKVVDHPSEDMAAFVVFVCLCTLHVCSFLLPVRKVTARLFKVLELKPRYL